MDCIPSPLSGFVKNILENRDFLSFRDDTDMEWVCVFDFLYDDKYVDLFKSIFEVFGVLSDKIELKEADIIFRGPIKNKYEYDLVCGRDEEIKNFLLRGVSEIEREYLQDKVVTSAIYSLYMPLEDFKLVIASVKREYLDINDIEYLKVSFDVDYSCLIFGNVVCKIGEVDKNEVKSLKSFIAEYFFADDNRKSENWEVLYETYLKNFGASQSRNPRKMIKDAMNAINKETRNNFGFDCLSLERDEIINLQV